VHDGLLDASAQSARRRSGVLAPDRLVDEAGFPVVLPVNYVLDGELIVFRSDRSTKRSGFRTWSDRP
jgi:hypothetical protein